MMASVQSAGIEQRSHTRVKSVRSQVTIAFPPYFRSSALVPEMPGARLFFSFFITVSISSDVGGPVSMVALGTAIAAPVCRRISGVGGVLLNCSTNCAFHLCNCSLGSLSWSPSLLTTGGRELSGCLARESTDGTVQLSGVSSFTSSFSIIGDFVIPRVFIAS